MNNLSTYFGKFLAFTLLGILILNPVCTFAEQTNQSTEITQQEEKEGDTAHENSYFTKANLLFAAGIVLTGIAAYYAITYKEAAPIHNTDYKLAVSVKHNAPITVSAEYNFPREGTPWDVFNSADIGFDKELDSAYTAGLEGYGLPSQLQNQVGIRTEGDFSNAESSVFGTHTITYSKEGGFWKVLEYANASFKKELYSAYQAGVQARLLETIMFNQLPENF